MPWLDTYPPILPLDAAPAPLPPLTDDEAGAVATVIGNAGALVRSLVVAQQLGLNPPLGDSAAALRKWGAAVLRERMRPAGPQPEARP